MEELKINVQSLEKERDFYFAKLRNIEGMAGHAETAHKELAENILNILYATEVGNIHFGFVYQIAFLGRVCHS